MVDFSFRFSEFKNCLPARGRQCRHGRTFPLSATRRSDRESTTKGQGGELGSQQLEIDVAKDLVFALREVGLETDAL